MGTRLVPPARWPGQSRAETRVRRRAGLAPLTPTCASWPKTTAHRSSGSRDVHHAAATPEWPAQPVAWPPQGLRHCPVCTWSSASRQPSCSRLIASALDLPPTPPRLATDAATGAQAARNPSLLRRSDHRSGGSGWPPPEIDAVPGEGVFPDSAQLLASRYRQLTPRFGSRPKLWQSPRRSSRMHVMAHDCAACGLRPSRRDSPSFFWLPRRGDDRLRYSHRGLVPGRAPPLFGGTGGPPQES